MSAGPRTHIPAVEAYERPPLPVKGRESEADTLLLRVLANAVQGRPSLEEMGYRAWIMAATAHCSAVCPKAKAANRKRMADIVSSVNGALSLGAVEAEAAMDVFRLVIGKQKTAWRIGRRVSLLAYALNRSDAVRRALPSLEVIGALWGLTAGNKRSAPSAALKKLKKQLFRGRADHVTWWFEKKGSTCEKYAKAQAGNTNRSAASEDAEAEEEEARAKEVMEAVIVEGVPVKPLFVRMTAVQRVAYLRREHAMREWMAVNPDLGCTTVEEASRLKARLEREASEQ